MGKVKTMAQDELDEFLDSLNDARRDVFESRVDSQRESDPFGVMRDMKAGKYKHGGAVMPGRGGKFKGTF
tara:strand:- start:6416 stop:6625 length:210 start_codon:yes stop_codon:yes gene_type:complete